LSEADPTIGQLIEDGIEGDPTRENGNARRRHHWSNDRAFLRPGNGHRAPVSGVPPAAGSVRVL
jgi:hypothetical protein